MRIKPHGSRPSPEPFRRRVTTDRAKTGGLLRGETRELRNRRGATWTECRNHRRLSRDGPAEGRFASPCRRSGRQPLRPSQASSAGTPGPQAGGCQRTRLPGNGNCLWMAAISNWRLRRVRQGNPVRSPPSQWSNANFRYRRRQTADNELGGLDSLTGPVHISVRQTSDDRGPFDQT